jgi:sigma-B regulation protein RsbU (phosphoserine phosphatase)
LLVAALKRALIGEDELDESELSIASGVAPATIRRLWRAMGFPDAEPDSRTFTRADVIALRDVAAVLASRGEDAVVEDARVLSSLLARAADVIARSLTGEIANDGQARGANADAAAVVHVRLLEISALLDYLFRRQLLTELTRQVIATPETATRSATQPAAVIFADLVGFTTLTEQLEDDELAALVSRFQSVAFDLVATGGGRVVKTLGDGVMVVCEDVDIGFRVATALANSYADEELLPDARVGMAYGPVLAAQGDFFGPTVNLASRLVAVAPPGVVVVSDEARLALDAETQRRLTQFGPRRLKGIGWTTSWVAKPPEVESEEMTNVARDGFYAALLDDDAEELYERAPCGYLSTTPDGTIIKVNQTFLTWTRYQRSELVGRRRFIDLLTGGGRIYHETHYAPMLQGQGTAREIALDIVGADRRRIPALVNAVLERDATGAPVVIRVAVFDATERRQYERELQRSKEQAEESERHSRLLARTLQQSLIPPALPPIPGIDIAAAYRPAGSGDEVGGDFYDVFEVGDGDWVFVIGDVCGKGVEAAVVTALARYTVRAAAARYDRPSEILETLNTALLRHGSGQFCTVALARLSMRNSRCSVTLCAGGHPLPLLTRAGVTPVPVGLNGTLLGMFDAVVLRDHELVLRPGDQLVFFTDGVTEGRRGNDFYGDERLQVAVAGHTSAGAVVDRVLHDVLQFQANVPADDIAILAICVPLSSAS